VTNAGFSSVWPRLPIDRDHHCDAAFYLTAGLPPALYYSIPYTQISAEEEEEEEEEAYGRAPV